MATRTLPTLGGVIFILGDRKMLSQILQTVGIVLFFGTTASAIQALGVVNRVASKKIEKKELSSVQVQLALSYLGMATGAIIFLLGLLEKGIRQGPF